MDPVNVVAEKITTLGVVAVFYVAHGIYQTETLEAKKANGLQSLKNSTYLFFYHSKPRALVNCTRAVGW
jgi:hypothetical protein